MLRLPCKTGNIIYYICNIHKKVCEDKIRSVETKNGTVIIETVANGFMWGSEFGKRIFLSEKEAEQALAEIQGK